MRVLGLDIGKRRIGVAVSDPLGLVARPVDTVQSVSLNKDVERIAQIARELEAELIVVGDPVHMSGEAGSMSRRAHRFGERLQQVSGLPVVYCDERLTTFEAHRLMQEAGVPLKEARRRVDAVAAALILQSYLNTERKPQQP
jgi:putative Holliday junction resolvase